MSSHLITAHGGALVDLMVSPARAAEIKAQAKQMPSWSLKPRQIADLELLVSGAFSPLAGFLRRSDYESVVREMRLADGTLWPLPVILDVPEEFARSLKVGQPLALRDVEGVIVAVLHVEETWPLDLPAQAQALCASTDTGQPGPRHILRETGAWAVGGRVEGSERPHHYDFAELRLTPAALREHFATLGWNRVAAFHTGEVMHRAEQQLTLAAGRELEADLLIQLGVATSAYWETSHYSRIRCLESVVGTYPHGTAQLNLLPLAPRETGARDLLLNAIVAQNCGATHFIVRGGAAGASDPALTRAATELKIQLARVPERAYVEERAAFLPLNGLPAGAQARTIGPEELGSRLAWGREVAPWFSFPEVIQELRRAYPPRAQQGFTVFFTGLPSSGKSTLANVLLVRLLELGGRPVTLLDGDIVRKNLSSELGFSREHRDLNIRRIGFVASEITKNGGIAICAPIAPFDAVRKEVRAMIAPLGGFLLAHVATPVSVCETRDRKGLYAKARAGIIKEFTGISDPYEEPRDADIVIDTSELSPEECVQAILLHLEKEGYVGTSDSSTASA